MFPPDRRTLLLGLAALLLLAAAVTFARGHGDAERPPAPIATAGTVADGAGGVPPAPEEPILVHVTGAVRDPGVYRLPQGSRVGDAVERAGGPRRDADVIALNLAALLVDGEQVLVPEAIADAPPITAAAAGGILHLNSADLDDLDALPGIGPATAERIIAWRSANGGFTAVEDLLEVPGIGPAKLAGLRDLVAP